GLDPVTLKRTKEILTDLKKNTLIILSTHQLEVAQTFCDKIVLMNEGTIEEKVTDINKIIEEFDTLENYFMFHFDK
ncbi:TPA: ABC transporter ATP-binding protein, partial [Bacillus cereus]|nr:ABC transporter ATP-binding protein [Bacillus cereus]